MKFALRPGSAAVQTHLAGEEPLPPPNLGFLRGHREESLRAVREVSGADGVVLRDEREMIEEIESLLGEPC